MNVVLTAGPDASIVRDMASEKLTIGCPLPERTAEDK